MSGRLRNRDGGQGAGGEGPPHGKAEAAALREERLKAALKANMARRKAQVRARRETDASPTDGNQTDGEHPADKNQNEE